MCEAGEQTNSIPGRCRLTVDRRTLPGEGRDSLIAEISNLVQRLPADEASRVADPDFFVQVPAGEALAESTLASHCQALLESMGVKARIRDFPACCDQFVFTGKGIDCVLVGPGDLAEAHAANKSIAIDQLLSAREFYCRFLESKLLAP